MAYDNNGYSKSLEKIVEMSEKEYYTHLVDINRHQVIVSRTLLWMSVVVIGLNFTLSEQIFSIWNGVVSAMPAKVLSLLFVFFSIVVSVVAFGFSALAIPAFGGYRSIYVKSWAEFTKSAYADWDSKVEHVYEGTLSKLLKSLDSACAAGNSTNHKRGMKLRISSILVLISAGLSTAGFLVFGSVHYIGGI